MNIAEFVSRFSDLIPYQFELSVGGKRKDEIVIDKNYISENNFKGKMIPSEKKNGNLVPIQDVSLMINFKFKAEDPLEPYFIVYDKTGEYGTASFNLVDMTHKDGSKHFIRILNGEGRQVGCIELELNASGDITHKMCLYKNLNSTHEVRHIVDIKFCDGQFRREESTTYTEKALKGDIVTTAQICQVDGITTGVLAVKRGDASKDYLLARTESPSHQDAIFQCTCCPEFSYVIQNDLTLFQGQFVGEYTGNTILISEGTEILMVRTSDDEFNYYTEINLEGVDPLVGAWGTYFSSYSCENERVGRDPRYFERLQMSSKEPKFKTKMVNGEECLIPKNGEAYSLEEIEEFNKFKDLCLEPFDELSKIKVGKLMQKKK